LLIGLQVAFRKRHIISDDQISALTFHFSNAQHVDLAGCYHLTSKAFSNICTTLPQLRTLDVAECRALCDEALDCITSLTRLEVLRLSGLWQLRDFPLRSVQSVFRAPGLGSGRPPMPSLRVLDLAWCSSIPADRFPGLANAFPQLEELDVRLTSCKDVAMLLPLVHLRRLHLSRPWPQQPLVAMVPLLGRLPALEGVSMEHPYLRTQPEFPIEILPPHLRLLVPRPRRT
jgi:hypothetical protein